MPDSAGVADSFAPDTLADTDTTTTDTFVAPDTAPPPDTAVLDTFVPVDAESSVKFAFPRCIHGDVCPGSRPDGSALLLGSQSVSGMRDPPFFPTSVRFDLRVNLDTASPACGPAHIDVRVESVYGGSTAVHRSAKALVEGDSTVSYTTDVVPDGLLPPLKVVVERRAGTGCPGGYVTIKSTSTVAFIP